MDGICDECKKELDDNSSNYDDCCNFCDKCICEDCFDKIIYDKLTYGWVCRDCSVL